MFAASKTDSVSGAAPDGQFNYVTMLLHGDGTNGGQNNTFLDSSTNNFSITRNGNTTQGSFSPYGSGWSNYFDGTGDYLSIADNASLDMGSSSFTIEGWFLPTADVGAGKGVFGKRANNGVVGGLLFYFSSTGLTPRLLADIGGSWGVDITASSGFTLGQWNHFATVRNSNTWTIYINGTSVGSATNSGTVTDNSAAFTIMAESAAASEGTTLGYISNFRVVKGTAVYTANFTPSTTPLTAITNTSLLTCQSNRFIENSTNNFTITRNGDTSVQRFNPFGTSTAYSTSVIGGSGYFDGSGDYLTTTMTGGLGSGDFTVEIWVYATSIYNYITWFATTRDANGFSCGTDANGALVWVNGVGGTTRKWDGATTAGNIIRVNSWNHVAFVRSSNAMRVYLNGVATVTTGSASSVSDTANYSNTNLSIGQLVTGGENPTGYLCDGRITTSALYTSNFTPPTAPLTAVSGVRLLNNYTNGAIFDNAMMNDLETVGNAQISTSVVKYGTGSLAFDGTGDYLLGASNPNMSFGAGDFTVEAWVYTQGTSGNNQTIFQKGRGADSNLEFAMSLNGSNQLTCFYTTDGSTVVQPVASSNTVSLSTWTHIAISRSGSTWRCFVDGTLRGSGTYAATLYTGTGRISSGANPVGDNPFTGCVDELRITKGYCRYTATFTPPTSALSDTGPY